MAMSYRWTPEEQREYSLAKVLRYIRECIYPYHPYYRRLFREKKIEPGRLASYRGLREIPVTEKESILDEPGAFVVKPAAEGSRYDVRKLSRTEELRYALKALTRGYMRDIYGKPRSFADRVRQTFDGEWQPLHYHQTAAAGSKDFALYTNHDLRKVMPYIAGMVYLFGWEPGMRGLNLLPAVTDPFFFQVLCTGFGLDEGNSMFHTFGAADMPVELQVRIAGNIPFDMYIATPSYMKDWLDTAIVMIQAGESRKPGPVRFASLAAEPLGEERRAGLKDRFERIGSPDVRIIETYGSTELKAAFFECDEGTMPHLNPEFYFWEVLDPETREPVDWGEPGVLCFSHVGWRGTVLLRYWTGDLIQGGVIWERCPACGLTMPVLRPPVERLARGCK